MRNRRDALVWAIGVVALAGTPVVAQGQAEPRGAAAGRIGGRIVDVQSGSPVVGAQVEVLGQGRRYTTDLDGRYRTIPLPVGRYSVRARYLGMQPRQYDSVEVRANETATVNFGLTPAAVTLSSVVISATRQDARSSEVALLAIQQKAAAASDGLSAEQLKRTPDSDAADAAVRVTGVSVVDNKFVVVRGLEERYSNTLLNGVDVASPEPAKKIVPLDVFPSSLLDAIVVTKTATPDKPGDFTGGSVELRTKEFPDNTVLEWNLGLGHDSRTTGRTSRIPVARGSDFLAIDRGRRDPPTLPYSVEPFANERFAESIRNEWLPPLRRVAPNLSAGASLGGRVGPEALPLGYLLSFNYGAGSTNVPDRVSQFITDPSAEPVNGFRFRDRRYAVDWGALANLSARIGATNKLGLKNLYTRNAEETYSTSEGFNIDKNGDLRGYQFTYTERDLLQSQLSGEHYLTPVSGRFEWRLTGSWSGRDEPDNRQVIYVKPPQDSAFTVSASNDAWFRSLRDRQLGATADLEFPFPFLKDSHASIKVGGVARKKVREFAATLYSFGITPGQDIPSGFSSLPPEQLFTPENIGTWLSVTRPGALSQPYVAYDTLLAGYAMSDVFVVNRVRLVGGVRMERWGMTLYDGGQAIYRDTTTSFVPTIRSDTDWLWSGNITVTLTDRANLRLAAFRSVARPDTRELSRDEFTEFVGGCSTIGNPALRRTTVGNTDIRWEWYPDVGELIAVSAFHKAFHEPIVRTIDSRNVCTFTYQNAASAVSYGGEFEVRKSLASLAHVLANFTVAANVTLVKSRVTMNPLYGRYDADLPLEGQSPYLLNASLSYASDRWVASVLVNRHGDRVDRYGFRSAGGEGATQGPNIVEFARTTIDAKVQRRLPRGFAITLSGRNLTSDATRFYQETDQGRMTTGYASRGIGLSVGLSYAR